MLLLEDGINSEQITVEQLQEIMDIPEDIFKKLQTSPVFEINPGLTVPDRLNGGVIAPAGRQSKPVIKVKVRGVTKTIRYATSVVPDRVNPRISTYEPKRVTFNDRLEIYPDFELALFMYCLPICADSPQAIGEWHYSFQNKEKKAKAVTSNAAKVAECWALINNSEAKGGLSDYEITLVAKGIYAQNREQKVLPNPSAKNKTVAEIRADLTEMSAKNPDLFLSSTDNDINEFYGMVLDAVDRGIFVIRTSGTNARTWYWAQGAMKDNVITDIKSGQNDFDALRAAIEADPNRVYSNLVKAVKEGQGKDNLAQFITKEKAKEKQAANTEAKSKPAVEPVNITGGSNASTDVDDTDDEQKEQKQSVTNNLTVAVPENYDKSVELITFLNAGKRPAPEITGAFWRGIKEKSITAENIKEKAAELLSTTEK